DALRSVYASTTFLSRLALYAGARLEARVDRWSPLRDWWTTDGARSEGALLRARVLEHAPEIATDLASLRAWTPPVLAGVASAFGDRYRELAERYLECRAAAVVQRAPPGPLTGSRHPGFSVAFDPKRRALTVRERPS